VAQRLHRVRENWNCDDTVEQDTSLQPPSGARIQPTAQAVGGPCKRI